MDNSVRIEIHSDSVEYTYDDIMCVEYNEYGNPTGNTLELLSPKVELIKDAEKIYLLNNFHPHVRLEYKYMCLQNNDGLKNTIHYKQYENLYWPIYDYLSVCNNYNAFWYLNRTCARNPYVHLASTTHVKQSNLYYNVINCKMVLKCCCLPLKNDHLLYIYSQHTIDFYNGLTEDEKDINLIRICQDCGRYTLTTRECKHA